MHTAAELLTRHVTPKLSGPSNLGSWIPKVPVQASIDIAVPLMFVWQQWMELQFLPQGVSRVIEITRDGDQLAGRLAGRSGSDTWRARILDERACESFAWRSTEGSDCAGLVTFHRLSERLTRLEVDLDVVPVTALDAMLLVTGLARRRTTAELRKFKAGLEFVSPDVYQDGQNQTGG